ncbi:hypothetical protein WA171_002140 [Blastocystis sp. BT1]
MNPSPANPMYPGNPAYTVPVTTVDSQPPVYYPQPIDGVASVNTYPTPQVVVQASPAYPQPQPMYVPGYVQQNPQNVVVTHEMMEFFGYAHAASIYAIVELVCYCISIVGLILIYIPICGIRLTKFDDSSYCCYYCWRVFSLVCAIFSAISLFTYDLYTGMSALVGVAIQVWAFYVTQKAYAGFKKASQQYSQQQLCDAYTREGAPCRCF